MLDIAIGFKYCKEFDTCSEVNRRELGKAVLKFTKEEVDADPLKVVREVCPEAQKMVIEQGRVFALWNTSLGDEHEIS